VSLDPNSVDAILSLTTAQIARGSIKQAIASYQRAIRQDPRDVRAYVLLGSLQESRGNWQEAQQQYQKAISVQPNNPAAANNLAYLLLEHGGNIDVALSLAQTARRLMPDMPNTADTLAWVYVSKGAFGLAVDLLQEAIHASPANPTYHYHLGVAYQKSNDAPRARAQFERALQLNPPGTQIDQIRKALSQTAGG
jgi:Flp pilus assembly protein TadD